MNATAHQLEFRGIGRDLYTEAVRMVRAARHSPARRRDVQAVQRFFRPGMPWYEAVQAACRVTGMDFDPPIEGQGGTR